LISEKKLPLLYAQKRAKIAPIFGKILLTILLHSEKAPSLYGQKTAKLHTVLLNFLWGNLSLYYMDKKRAKDNG